MGADLPENIAVIGVGESLSQFVADTVPYAARSAIDTLRQTLKDFCKIKIERGEYA